MEFSLGGSHFGRPKGKTTREFGMTLCIQVLKTLNSLMQGNKRVQDHFKQDVGYEYLGGLLLRAEYSVPSREIFDALFCMLFEMEDWASDDNDRVYIIKNQGVLNLMFQLLPHCQIDHQLDFLNTLTAIVSQCPLNQTFCAKAHVIDSCLVLFRQLRQPEWRDEELGEQQLLLQRKVIDLIKLLGTHSMSVKQLKPFFGLLKNQTVKLPSGDSIELRPTYGSQLLSAIEEMTQKEGPENFFYFDGNNSGLELPEIEWPRFAGVSFSSWIRIDSFSFPYQPRLFHFMTTNRLGIEVYFLDERLVIETTLKGGSQKAVVEYLFPLRKWFYLVITHAAPPTFGVSELKVFVDGECVHGSMVVKYPLLNEPFTHCFIGTDEKCSPNALAGQLGPIYFFNDTLTPKQVEILHKLHPEYVSPFSDDMNSTQERARPKKGVPKLKPGLSSRIFLAYNVKARDGTLFLNNASRAPSSVSGKKKTLHASSLPGTHQCVTRHVKDVIACLGGIQVLLPLFAQVDLPTWKTREVAEVQSTQQTSRACEAELADFSYEPDPSFFVNILRVFRVMLEGNSENQAWMQKHKGFSVIGVQLEKISPLHFSLDALDVLEKLSDAIADEAKLLEDCFFGILARMRLWIYTSAEVQRKWLAIVQRIVNAHPCLLQKDNGYAVWRSLQAVCWYEKQENSQAPNMKLYHRITYALIGQRPEVEMLDCIRITFMSLFQEVWHNGVTAEEVSMILTFLQACQDERQKAVVLQAVLWLMNNKTTSLFFLRQLAVSGPTTPRPLDAGFFVFLDLLSSPQLEVRVLTLRGIERMLRNPESRLDPEAEHSLCVAMGDVLARVHHELTEQTYFILCSIMAQKKIDLHNYEKRADSKVPPPESRQGEPPRAGILPIIFSLLPEPSSDPTKNVFLKTVLKDQLNFFDNFKGKQSIVQQPGWQTWFFDLMLSHTNKEQRNEASPRAQLATVGGFVLHGTSAPADRDDLRAFFSNVFFHCLGKSTKEAVKKSVLILATYHAHSLRAEAEMSEAATEESSELAHTNEGEAEFEEKTLTASQGIDPVDIAELDASASLPVLSIWLHVLEDIRKNLEQAKLSQYDLGTLVMNCIVLLDHTQDMLLSLVNEMVLDVEADLTSLDNVWPIVRAMNQIRQWALDNWDTNAPDAGAFSSGVGLTGTFMLGTLTRKPSKAQLRPDISPGPKSRPPGLESVFLTVLRLLLTVFPLNRGQASPGPTARILFNSRNTMILINLLNSLSEVEKQSILSLKVLGFLNHLCVMLNKIHVHKPFGGVKVLPGSGSLVATEYLCTLILTLLQIVNNWDLEPNMDLGDLDDDWDYSRNEEEARPKNLGAELAAQDNRIPKSSREDSVAPRDSGVGEEFSMVEGSLLEGRSVKLPPIPFELIRLPLNNVEDALPLEDWHARCIEFLVHSVEWERCRAELKQMEHKLAKQQKAQQERCGRFTRGVRAQQAALLKAKRERLHLCQKMQAYSKTVANYHVELDDAMLEAYTENQKKERQSSSALWRTFYRALTNERGPWSQFADLPEAQRPQVFWKVDDCENHQRMRAKLKINYAGVDHSEASQNIPEKEEVESEEKNEQTLRELLRSISKSVVMTDDQPEGEQKQPGEVPEEDTEEIDSVELFNAVDTQDEKELIKCNCTMVNPMNCIAGKIRVTTRFVYFDANPDHQLATSRHCPETNEIREKLTALLEQICETRWNSRWPLIEIRALHYRRYQLRQNALELFFEDQNSSFFHFPTKDDRNAVHRHLATYSRALRKGRQQGRPRKEDELLSFNYPFSESRPTGADILRRSSLTQLWKLRKISNFDYLMHLNALAGRTYKDLTQYPVFPWVLSNYESETLDLNDPNNYRDLSKPMGAQDEKRLKMYIERYQSLDEDATMKKFHYGTHYSAAGTVLFFLIRIEPFTTLSILLQDGKFDHPDRMFHSIPMTWRGCLTNPADVKELIPEWFYLPELFKNTNKLNLGSKQQGEPIGDVILPPWAKTPEEFVRINRAALESEHVSRNLHKWIDLIFGEKQKGPKAVEAHNVFFYLTYEGSVNIDSIEDTTLREATLAQIEHFGQTPSQLLTTPHISRLTHEDLTTSIFARFNELHLYRSEKVTSSAENPLLFIQHCHEHIVTVGLDRIVGIHKWRNSTPEYVPPFLFEVEALRGNRKKRRIGVHFAVGLHILPCFFAVSTCERFIFSCGHWDNSFRCSHLETGDLEASISAHKDIVTCMAISQPGDILVTGSKDTTVMLWELDPSHSYSYDAEDTDCFISDKPKHILYGHNDEVTCVAINRDFDIVVSGSMDGSCIVHTIRKGEYCRTIKPPPPPKRDHDPPTTKPTDNAPLRWVGIASTGSIVTYSLVDRMLHTYSINGDHIAEASAGEKLYAMMFSENGEFLITGGDRGVVVIRFIHNLKIAHKFSKAEGTIRSLACTPNEQHLLVGLQTGNVQIYALNAAFLRKKFLRRLANLGF